MESTFKQMKEKMSQLQGSSQVVGNLNQSRVKHISSLESELQNRNFDLKMLKSELRDRDALLEKIKEENQEKGMLIEQLQIQLDESKSRVKQLEVNLPSQLYIKNVAPMQDRSSFQYKDIKQFRLEENEMKAQQHLQEMERLTLMQEQTKSMRDMMLSEQEKILLMLQDTTLSYQERQELEIREQVIKSELQILLEKENGLKQQERMFDAELRALQNNKATAEPVHTTPSYPNTKTQPSDYESLYKKFE